MKSKLSLINLFLVSIIFFSCSKNADEKLALNQQAKKIDTSSISRSKDKAVTDVCGSPLAASPYQSPSTYVIIARFPINSGQPNVIIPKSTWYANGYHVQNQTDGNLCLYSPSHTYLWGTHTAPSNNTFYLQSDLNMAAYNSNGVHLWNTSTHNFKCGFANPRNAMLVLTNQGDLQIIADGVNSFGAAITITLGTTRTTNGVVSPNDGQFFKQWTTGSNPYGYSFVY